MLIVQLSRSRPVWSQDQGLHCSLVIFWWNTYQSEMLLQLGWICDTKIAQTHAVL